jgi:hypothetical protein
MARMACFLMPPIADVAAGLGLTADLLEQLGYGKLPVCIAKTQGRAIGMEY